MKHTNYNSRKTNKKKQYKKDEVKAKCIPLSNHLKEEAKNMLRQKRNQQRTHKPTHIHTRAKPVSNEEDIEQKLLCKWDSKI